MTRTTLIIKGQKPGLAALFAEASAKAPKVVVGRLRLDLSIKAANQGVPLK